MSIPERLLSEAKRVAASTGRSLSQVVEDALRESFARQERPGQLPFRMPTFPGRGAGPGVDLDDSSALQDLMDEGTDPARLR